MPTEYSAVIAMPPCSWMASWPMWRAALLVCSAHARPRRRSASRSPVEMVIVAQSTTLWVSSRETYMSAARNVSAWKVLSVTPNCLRLLRYDVVAASWACITPSAWLAAITRVRSSMVAMLAPRSTSGLAQRRGRRRRRGRPARPARRRTSRSRCASRRRRRRVTRNRPVPPSGRAAVTTSRSARAPWRTGSLMPESVHVSPSRSRWYAGAPLPSGRPAARRRDASTRSPLASRAEQLGLCSAEPAAETRPPASTTPVR